MTFPIIPLLQERGYEMALMPGLLALHGPSQVMARLLVVLLGKATSTATLGRLSFGMLVVAMLLLCLGASLGVPGLVAYIMLYGAASGPVIVVSTTSTLDYLGGYGSIGRASCRERVCQYVSVSVGAGTLKKKKKK